MTNILLFDSSTIKLNDGYTLNDYIIRANAEKVSYDRLCRALKLTFDEARAIYDKVWNIPLIAIGSIKPPKLMSSTPKPSRLQFIRSGTDWRHSV